MNQRRTLSDVGVFALCLGAMVAGAGLYERVNGRGARGTAAHPSAVVGRAERAADLSGAAAGNMAPVAETAAAARDATVPSIIIRPAAAHSTLAAEAAGRAIVPAPARAPDIVIIPTRIKMGDRDGRPM